jgi:hypothetical protein
MILICVALHHGQPFAWLRLRQYQRPSVMAKSKQVECGALTSESSLMSQINWSHSCAIQHSNRLNPEAFKPSVNQQPIAFNPHANQFSDTFDFNVHQPPSIFNLNANIQASCNPQFLGGASSLRYRQKLRQRGLTCNSWGTLLWGTPRVTPTRDACLAYTREDFATWGIPLCDLPACTIPSGDFCVWGNLF